MSEQTDNLTETTAETAPNPKRRSVLRTLVTILLLAGIGTGLGYGGRLAYREYRAFMVQFDRQQSQNIEQQAEIARLQERLDALLAADATRDEQLAGVRDRMDNLATGMEDLRQAAQGGRRDLLKSEIEWLLRISADELYLTGDVTASLYAMQAADDRLRQLDDPALNPVRRSIAAHIANLNAIVVPDTSGIAFKLGSMQTEIGNLPLAQSDVARAAIEVTSETAEDATLWQRIKAGLDRVLFKLVAVSSAEPPAPLLSPEESFFLYRNLELQIAAARAALLQNDARAYRQSLQNARAWLIRYFDNDDNRVRSTLADINGLLEVNLQPELPDISEPLTILRSINARRVRN